MCTGTSLGSDKESAVSVSGSRHLLKSQVGLSGEQVASQSSLSPFLLIPRSFIVRSVSSERRGSP